METSLDTERDVSFLAQFAGQFVQRRLRGVVGNSDELYDGIHVGAGRQQGAEGRIDLSGVSGRMKMQRCEKQRLSSPCPERGGNY